jgi:hypothetical protein
VTDERPDPIPPEPVVSSPDGGDLPTEPREPRPMIERIGLAAIAFALAAMFGGVGYAAWLGGELFLAVIGGISCVMTVWVGALTLLRG